MRELAIGDIHGCARAFQTLLDVLRPERTDTIILLGDYIDRGPDSCEVIDMILELNRRCTVIPLAGNHEKMILRARTDPEMLAEWLIQGGQTTLDSYKRHGYAREIDAIPACHWQFLAEQTLDYWETDDSIFVHASIDADLDLPDQPDFLLFWQPFTDPTIHKSGKRIICGHTSQKSGLPAVFDRGICLDTWAHGGGWLTCFDTVHDSFIQSNDSCEHRTFGLRTVSNNGDQV
jgi:serine/threonine protein phosphatase 1